MNAHLMPGMGDYEALQTSSPLDPRVFDDAMDDDDCTLDTLEKVRDWADIAEVAHTNGDDEKARKCLDEIRCLCDEVLG